MLRASILFFLLLISNSNHSQELIKTTRFPIRDFFIKKDTLIFSEHTSIHVLNTKKNKDTMCFVGGSSFKIEEVNDEEIIIAVNELVRNVSSVRFYKKKANQIADSFFYRKGKIIDFLVIKELKLFVMATTNNKILFFNYREKPKFTKVAEIDLEDTKSRKIVYKDNNLYYTTDKGKIFKYNLSTYKRELLIEDKSMITTLSLYQDCVFYATVTGQINKYNLKNNEKRTLEIKRNFILNFIINQNQLVCGSWKGDIFVIDINDFKVEEKINYHKKTILNIIEKDDVFYSSSIDKTLKKWKLN